MKNWPKWFAGSMMTIFLLGMVLFILIWPVGCSHPIAEPTDITLTLYWTAPGDNDNAGTASQYDLRFSTEPITDANWNSAIPITTGIPTPSIAGTPEQATFTFRAESEVTIYFAMKTADEVPNWSPLSNICSRLTPDIVSPAAVIDLRDVE